MSRIDNVQKLALDHSASEFSAAVGFPAAEADPAARIALVDCLNIKYVDVIVDITDLGTGPITQLIVVARCSSIADPDIADPSNWQYINTENLNTVTGESDLTPYIARVAITATGSHVITFPVRGRYFSALVIVDAATDSRGQVFTFRRGQE